MKKIPMAMLAVALIAITIRERKNAKAVQEKARRVLYPGETQEMGFGPMKINGQSMDMNRIDQTIKLNDTEIWEVINDSDFPHPFHVHDIQFLILTRDGSQPPENERGWKDTVLVMPRERVRIIAHFSDYTDPDKPYMFHCHILEHEDAGMMGQFVVV